METIAAYFHAARPRKAMVREVIRGHADDATLGPTDLVRPLAAADNLDEKSHIGRLRVFGGMRAFLFTLPNLAQDRHRARAKSSSRPVHPTAPTNSGPVGCPAVTGRRIGSIISLCSPKLSFLALWRLTVTFRCLHFVANAA